MPTEDRERSERRLCSFPLCGARADWLTNFFGETEYYCDSHKPIIPRSLLKRLSITASGGLVQD